MILFYNKILGKIEGTIDGRVHTEDHLKMWIGEGTERIVCQWEKVGEDYEPSLEPKDLWRQVEKEGVKNFTIVDGLLTRAKQ